MNPSQVTLLGLATIKLDLKESGIGDDGMKFLSWFLQDHPDVAYLILVANEISDVGVGYLCHTLNANSSDIALAGLWYSTNIISSVLTHLLRLCWNKITDEGARLLGEALKENHSLQELSLAENKVLCSLTSKYSVLAHHMYSVLTLQSTPSPPSQVLRPHPT